MKNIKFIGIVLFLGIFISCNSSSSKKEKAEKTTETVLSLPEFNADSAYAFVEKQVAFGPRVPGTKAHDACADYLTKKLESYVDKIYVQPFSAQIWNGKTMKGQNIIGSFNPETGNRILFGAHWDSRATADRDPDEKNWNKPIPGANDGASGIAVLLEIARQLSLNNTNLGIDIIFFDIEDQGTPEFAEETSQHTWCLGAQYWAENPHRIAYRAQYGILLDMVACQKPKFTKEGISMHFAPDIMNKVWDRARQLGFGKYFVNERTGEILDDHYYVNAIARIPMIDIIHYDPKTPTRFFPQWHTMQDDMDHIDKETMQMVGQVVLSVINN